MKRQATIRCKVKREWNVPDIHAPGIGDRWHMRAGVLCSSSVV